MEASFSEKAALGAQKGQEYTSRWAFQVAEATLPDLESLGHCFGAFLRDLFPYPVLSRCWDVGATAQPGEGQMLAPHT